MKTKKWLLLAATHGFTLAVGFAMGIYMLPILIAPPAPSETEIEAMASQSLFSARFTRDLKGSDTFHWGDGTVSIGEDYITLKGKLAPGPDYKLYLSPEFVETEAAFERLKSSMVRVGDVKTFENFAVAVSPEINVNDFTTVVVWCETFSEFISAAEYR